MKVDELQREHINNCYDSIIELEQENYKLKKNEKEYKKMIEEYVNQILTLKEEVEDLERSVELASYRE
jgi:phage host-nuclease inhibitor protein Gam